MNAPPENRNERIQIIHQLSKDYGYKQFINQYPTKYRKYPIGGYTIENLNTKIDFELDSLLSEFPEFKEFYQDKAEKERSFNKPNSDANYEYWAKQSFWITSTEGTALILGKDPRKVSYKQMKEFENVSPLAKKYIEIHDTAQRFIQSGNLTEKILPSFYLAWAIRMQFEIPAKLLEAADQLGVHIKDWQTLYEQETLTTEKLNNIIKTHNETDEKLLHYIEQLKSKIQELTAINEQLSDEARQIIDESHPCFSYELDLAITIQGKIIKSGDIKKSKQIATEFLEIINKNRENKLSDATINRITTIVNPVNNKTGGPRTKE